MKMTPGLAFCSASHHGVRIEANRHGAGIATNRHGAEIAKCSQTAPTVRAEVSKHKHATAPTVRAEVSKHKHAMAPTVRAEVSKHKHAMAPTVRAEVSKHKHAMVFALRYLRTNGLSRMWANGLSRMWANGLLHMRANGLLHMRADEFLPMRTCGLLAVLALLVLSACAVGPNYQRPEATTIPASYAGADDEWKVATPRAHLPKGNWWEMFGDPELNRLEFEATAANQDLKAAAARFEQARALADVARSGLFPRLGVAFQPTRQRDSENRPAGGKPGQTYNSLTVPFDLSYEVDLWGRVRRTVESAAAQEQAGADDIESVSLAIQAEVAADYFTIRALDADKALLLSSIEVYRKSLVLTRNRRAGGMVSDLDVAQAETVLNTAEAQVPDTELQRARFQNALAVLTGNNASLFSVPERTLDLAPPVIPPGLPSELLERRPDIAAAERRMAAANANIGVATAAFFPTVKFNGLAGFQSADVGMLFDWPSRLWAVGPSITLPLFQGGQLSAGLRQAKAVHEETVARYRQTVLTAFADVENNLAAEQLLAGEYEKLMAATQSARKQLQIANNRYNSGLVTYLEVATAQNTALGTERTGVRLRGQQLVAAVALIKSLGGGWQMTDN